MFPSASDFDDGHGHHTDQHARITVAAGQVQTNRAAISTVLPIFLSLSC